MRIPRTKKFVRQKKNEPHLNCLPRDIVASRCGQCRKRDKLGTWRSRERTNVPRQARAAAAMAGAAPGGAARRTENENEMTCAHRGRWRVPM